MGKASRPSPTGHFRLYKTNRSKDDQPLVIQMEYPGEVVILPASININDIDSTS